MDETKMKEKENTDNEEKTQENKETSSDGWGKIQRNAYQLTINNPAEHGLDHRTIKEILIKNFTTIEFFCMADEIGEQGTYHTHVYFFCSYISPPVTPAGFYPFYLYVKGSRYFPSKSLHY